MSKCNDYKEEIEAGEEVCLRPALRYLYQTPGAEFKVINPNEFDEPKFIRFRGSYFEGCGAGNWQKIEGWWATLTRNNVRFILVSASSCAGKVVEIEGKKYKLVDA